MTLLIDLGNSRLKWTSLPLKSAAASEVFEHGGQLSRNDLARLGDCEQRPESVVCAAVAGQSLVDALNDFCMKTWNLEVQYASSAARMRGLVNSYQDPGRLGVDRWLAMLAARNLIDGWFCLIDAGTAITVDLVDANGQHHGGWIVPGEQLMRRSLVENTGRISVEPAVMEAQWGVSTNEAVNLGAQAAVAGLTAQAEHQAIKFASQRPQFVVTGGGGSRIIGFLDGPAMLVPDLVLDGLALWVREMQND
jgi:type III pantothenate kinase